MKKELNTKTIIIPADPAATVEGENMCGVTGSVRKPSRNSSWRLGISNHTGNKDDMGC